MQLPKSLILIICLIHSNLAQAQDKEQDEPVNKPLISQPVKLVFQEQFNRNALGEHWITNRGSLALSQGALVCDSSRDKHDRGAGTSNFAAPCGNLGLTCRIKPGTSEVCGIGITGKGKGESGYVVAFYIQPRSVQANADLTSIGRKQLVVDRDQWHDVMLEVIGNRVVVQLDGEKVIDAENHSIGKFNKAGVAFIAVGGMAAIDDIIAGEVVGKE